MGSKSAFVVYFLPQKIQKRRYEVMTSSAEKKGLVLSPSFRFRLELFIRVKKQLLFS